MSSPLDGVTNAPSLPPEPPVLARLRTALADFDDWPGGDAISPDVVAVIDAAREVIMQVDTERAVLLHAMAQQIDRAALERLRRSAEDQGLDPAKANGMEWAVKPREGHGGDQDRGGSQ